MRIKEILLYIIILLTPILGISIWITDNIMIKILLSIFTIIISISNIYSKLKVKNLEEKLFRFAKRKVFSDHPNDPFIQEIDISDIR